MTCYLSCQGFPRPGYKSGSHMSWKEHWVCRWAGHSFIFSLSEGVSWLQSPSHPLFRAGRDSGLQVCHNAESKQDPGWVSHSRSADSLFSILVSCLPLGCPWGLWGTWKSTWIITRPFLPFSQSLTQFPWKRTLGYHTWLLEFPVCIGMDPMTEREERLSVWIYANQHSTMEHQKIYRRCKERKANISFYSQWHELYPFDVGPFKKSIKVCRDKAYSLTSCFIRSVSCGKPLFPVNFKESN